jgi:HEAT repeat protein/tetratricopeptide (TPR) repeat protein
MRRSAVPLLVVLAAVAASVACCTSSGKGAAGRASPSPDSRARLDVVMQSRFCGTCHPAIYAEHMQNTHGLAFVDDEARIATRDFRRENCVRCHTPRPIFETGLGMVPVERRFDLEEGNTCMTCHWKAGQDYSRFTGGAECRTAFDARDGTVEACATCHRIAGTPEQWEHAAKGKIAGRVCIDCHMPLVERPVAVGGPTKLVRSHTFPASHSEAQIRRAYAYDARLEGNELVVRITNKGAGHNFPTASVQRSLESLVVVRDAKGEEVTRTRSVFKHPYALADTLDLPVSTQIPSGQTREHRVPIHVASGTIECSLYFKNYYPIEDGHPSLSRRLESRVIPFTDVAPSTKPVDVPGKIGAPLPEVSPADAARPDGLAKFAHPAPGTKTVAIPKGDAPEDVARLVSLLDFPVPEARVRARERLLALGDRAVPALIDALGHWSDETFNQAMDMLVAMGPRATSAVVEALKSDRLYVRHHARMVLTRTGFPGDRARIRDELARGLAAPQPLDRRGAADALGRLGDAAAAPAIRPLLEDEDWDVVAAAARALGRLDDRGAAPAVREALARATFVESRRDLAASLAALGDPSGIPILLEGLDHPDDVLRRTFFDEFFAATGLHMSYDPDAPRRDRLDAVAALQSFWAAHGGPALLRRPAPIDDAAHEKAWAAVEALGGGTDVAPAGDDAALLDRLVAMGPAAVPALTQGLSFPTGFTRKRALLCEAMGKIGDKRATPWLVSALRDPNLSVSSWACWALAATGDEAALPALRRYSRRLAAYADEHPTGDGGELPARLIARAAWTRVKLGDESARRDLETFGGGAKDVAAAAPARAEGVVRTTEAPPVPEPTSNADAIAKAKSLRAQDYYEDAIAVLRVAEGKFGVGADTRLETAWNLLMVAEEDMGRDVDKARIDAEVADARMKFDEAVRLDPNVDGRARLEAQILQYEGRLDEARAVLEKLVREHPDDAFARQEFGYFAVQTKDWATAEREYSALAKLSPNDGWAVLYVTLARQWLGKPAGDLDAGYLQAARLLPEVQTPLRLLANLHAAEPERALALLDKVVADRPRAVWARIWIAHVLRTQPKPDLPRAEAVLREALAVAPRDQAARFNLGEVIEAQGRVVDALREYADSAESAAIGDAGDAADAVDRLLREGAVDKFPAELRLRAWNAVVAKSPTNGRYAHDAGRWYADVARDPATARQFLEAAAAVEPDNQTYREEMARAKSDPRLGQ